MRQENAIEVYNVTKSFRVYYDKGNQLKEKLLFKNRNRYENRQVLNNISFSVKKGEAIGLIGHNGCGKSTTLKLLTKIIYPDAGMIEMRGRVSSLIELGAGFHPDMSGRENIYTNAAIFGLSRKEIDERVDDIIRFSELEEFIDNPVRTYSSGMYMRLAFSVAINVDADILLIDEILAVGDAGFQTKCFNRLKEIKASGTTIVIVSHSMGQIEQICDKSYWIHNGEIKASGNPREIHPQYMDYIGEERMIIAKREAEAEKEKTTESENIPDAINEEGEADEIGKDKNKDRWGSHDAMMTDIRLLNEKNQKHNAFMTGEELKIQIKYKVKRVVKDAVFGIGIFRIDGTQCYGTNTRIDKLPTYNLEKDGEITIVIDQMQLLSGKYWIDLAIEEGVGIPVDYYRKALYFEVFSKIEDVGVARLEHKWLLDVET